MSPNRGDFYQGKQSLQAGYLMGNFSFFRKLRLIAGVRMEKNYMETLTKLRDSKKKMEVDSTLYIKQTDWLPAATLIYSIRPELSLRAAYSKTLARPDFRELSRVEYYNVDDRVYVFNPYPVEQSTIHNWDVRAKWYPRPGEVMSVGFFYKKFLKPVEMVMRMRSDGQNFDMFNLNLDQSTAHGFEVNWRKSLGFIAPSVAFLNDLYFTGNYTWLKADVTYNSQIITGGAISEEGKKQYKEFDRQRPLQGLSPYTLNLGLAYESERYGAAINYNRNGRSLKIAGEYKKFDQYENPRDVLDIQLFTRLLKNERLELKLNISDILNQDFIIYRNTRAVQYTSENPGPNGAVGVEYLDLSNSLDYDKGDWVMSRIRKGVNFSINLGWRF